MNWFNQVVNLVRYNQDAVVIPMDMASDKNKKGVLTSPEWVYNPMFGSPRRIDYSELEEYEMNCYVQSAINYIIDSVSGLDYKIVNDDEDEIDTKEVESFFKTPNSDKSFKTVLRALISDILLYDAGVLVLSYPEYCYDEDGILQIFDEKPISFAAYDGRSFIKDVTINGDIKNYYQYSFLSQAQRPVKFAKEEVIYLQEHPSTRSPYGTSKLDVVKSIADYLTAVSHGHRAGIENGMSPGGIIKHPNVTDPERLKQLSTMYNSKLQGEHNSKKWLVSGGEVDFIPITTSNTDTTWIEGSEFYLHSILSIFKVSASVLGFPNQVNRATSETMAESFKTNGVGVVIELLEEYLTREIVKRYFNENLSFKFTTEIDLNDELLRAEIDNKNILSGLTTINELRARDGKDPIEEPKDPEPEDVGKSLKLEDKATNAGLKLNEEQESAILAELEELYEISG